MAEWSPLEERAAIIQFTAFASPISRELAESIARRQVEQRDRERAYQQRELFPIPAGVRR